MTALEAIDGFESRPRGRGRQSFSVKTIVVTAGLDALPKPKHPNAIKSWLEPRLKHQIQKDTIFMGKK